MIPGVPVLPPPPAIPAYLVYYSWLAAIGTIPVLLIFFLTAPVILPERGSTTMLLAAAAIIWQIALILHFPSFGLLLPLLPLFWIPVALQLARPAGIGFWERDFRDPVEWLLFFQGLVIFWLIWNHYPLKQLGIAWGCLLVEWFCYQSWDQLVFNAKTRHRIQRMLGNMGFEVQTEVHVRAVSTFRIDPSSHSLGTTARPNFEEQVKGVGGRAKRTPFGEFDDDF